MQYKNNHKIKVIESEWLNDQIVRNTVTCPHCGQEARLSVGGTPFDTRLEQFHCDKCHCTFVLANGKFTRFGTLETEYW